MKKKASEYAAAGMKPSYDEARYAVTSFMCAEHVDPWPEGQVIDFYAEEMLVLILNAKEEEEPA
jgi:hypothetical protein